jgi:antitoxin (DNA-binding transcriptional repressor) of toxin-antitoxin stability system
MNLKRIGIREFQKRLSSHLRELKEGDTLVITKRGKAIARLEPVELPEVPVEEEFQRLIEAGIVSWSGRRLSSEVPRVPVRGPKTVAELLIEDRD